MAFGLVGSSTPSWSATLRVCASRSACSMPRCSPTSRTAGELACCAACWPVGPSQRFAWRTFTSRSRSAGPRGPHCVCVQPPVPTAPDDHDWYTVNVTAARMTNRMETRRNRGIRRSIVLGPFESDGGGAASDEVEQFGVDAGGVDVERVDDLQCVVDHRGGSAEEEV